MGRKRVRQAAQDQGTGAKVTAMMQVAAGRLEELIAMTRLDVHVEQYVQALQD